MELFLGIWGSPLCWDQHQHFSRAQETIRTSPPPKQGRLRAGVGGYTWPFLSHWLASPAPHCLQWVRQHKTRALLTALLPGKGYK